MNFKDIKEQYSKLETAQQKIDFYTKLFDVLEEIDKDNKENIVYCHHCCRHVYKKDLIKKLDVWKKTVCTNPLMGYLDDYEYEEREFVDFRYHCPLCDSVVNYYK